MADHTRAIVVVLLVAMGGSLSAQLQSRPTDPPLVTAVSESWYRLRDPIQFAGDLYHFAGPAVFFNGNTMVRTGHYNGVPLYADTTIEPFSIVLVPVGRGLMQPYERLRRGDLAGTTGSRVPLFPVPPIPAFGSRPPAAAVAPTAPPMPLGAISVFTPETPAPVGVRPDPVAAEPPRQSPAVSPPAPPVFLLTPESNDGIWIQFKGARWVSAGPAVALASGSFMQVGEYAGFPVYARQDSSQELIYLPTRPDLVAPYRMKQ